jgi:uncharacterized protein (DUF1015 family)
VPRFEPFAGIRYGAGGGSLDALAAPPYDVISPEDQAALEALSQHNAVRLELPREGDGRSRYEEAAALLQEWQRDGVLAVDERPSLYLYRMDFTDEAGRPRHTLGVIGALALEEPGRGDILPHEHTTPKAKSDRLELLQATQANLSPVWGLSLAAGLSDRCQPTGEPDARASDEDGVVHSLWVVDDAAQVSAISETVGSAPVVIADGHHRFEVALTYQAQQRAARSDAAGGWDLVMALVVELADDQLSVRAIHRLISGLPDGFDLVAALEPHFVISPSAAADATITERMREAGALALVTNDGAWLLVPRPATISAAAHDLDSSRLDVALATLPSHDLVYQHGWDLAAAAVEKGAADAAVLLRPATVAQIADTGRARTRMPPKTTFFWPKPRTGMVFRSVAG